MLGVVPVFANSIKTAVKITREGKKLGLKHKWSGIRPILPDDDVISLAESEAIFAQPYIRDIIKKDVVELLKRPTYERAIKELEGRIPLIKPKFVKVKEKEPPEISFQYLHETFINAWFKSYNEDYSDSGFFRIWDFGPRNLTIWMLDELYEIINNICRRLIKQRNKMK